MQDQQQPDGAPITPGIPPQLAAAAKKTQWQPGQSGNPNGRPKGSKNWSNVVQDMLFDDEFVAKVEGLMSKQNPIWDKLPNKNFAHIIVSSMLLKASGGDKQAAEWLRKTGFGDKLDLTTDGESINAQGTASQQNADLFAEFMKTQITGNADKPKTASTDAPTVAAETSQPQAAPQPQAENARPVQATGSLDNTLSSIQQAPQPAAPPAQPSKPHINIPPQYQNQATAVPATQAPIQSDGQASAVVTPAQPVAQAQPNAG